MKAAGQRLNCASKDEHAHYLRAVARAGSSGTVPCEGRIISTAWVSSARQRTRAPCRSACVDWYQATGTRTLGVEPLGWP